MNTMQAGLIELGVDIRKSDFFITHLHSDHLGLVSRLATKTSMINFNQPESDWNKSGIFLNDFVNFARLNGFPESEPQKALRSHPGSKYRLKGQPPFHILKEGNTISISDYLFKCLGSVANPEWDLHQST